MKTLTHRYNQTATESAGRDIETKREGLGGGNRRWKRDTEDTTRGDTYIFTYT